MRSVVLNRRPVATLELSLFSNRLVESVAVARMATEHLVSIAGTDPRSLLAASSPYLRLLATVVCGGLLAQAALAASGEPGDYPSEFLAAKVTSAKFFGEQILPTAGGLLPAVLASADELYALSPSRMG